MTIFTEKNVVVDVSQKNKKDTSKPDIIRQLVEKRHQKGITQSQVAVQMGTTASAVARLESGGGKKRHSPSLRTLKLYAEAVGYDIAMTLVAIK